MRHFYEIKRINCRGKIEHKFLPYVGFTCSVAPMIADVEREKT